jgi:hypothetical protein
LRTSPPRTLSGRADHFVGRVGGGERPIRENRHSLQTRPARTRKRDGPHVGPRRRGTGIGTLAAANEADTWGEFGGRIEAGPTDQLALDLDLSGITGGGALGTVLHCGAGVVLKF